MIELGDFARLQQVYGNDRFAIIPVLTGTQRRFTPQTLGELLAKMNAAVFEPLIEGSRGNKLLSLMAHTSDGPEIPCNLLIAPSGRVAGREISLQLSAASAGADGPKSNVDRMNQALVGNSQSMWGTAAGDEFASVFSTGHSDLK